MFGDSLTLYTSASNPNEAHCNNDTGSNVIASCDGLAIWSDDNTTTITMDAWNDLGMRMYGLPEHKCLAMRSDATPAMGWVDAFCNLTAHSICEFTCPSGIDANPVMRDCVAAQRDYASPYPAWVQSQCTDENYFVCEKRELAC